jgi:hypothetical protein
MAILDLSVFTTYYRSEIPTDDPLAKIALDAGIAVVRDMCKRSFDVASTDTNDATTRTYTPGCATTVLRIHDCTQIVSVSESGTALTAGTGYQAETVNGTQTIAWDGDTVPYEQLRRLYTCWYTDGPLPTVTVSALWGLAAVPATVTQAAAIAAAEIYDMRDVHNGVLAVTEAGVARVRENPMINFLLHKWRRAEATFGIDG